MTDFSASEGDNAEVIEQGDAQINKKADQDAVIAEQGENGGWITLCWSYKRLLFK